MRKWMARLQGSPWLVQKLALLAIVAGVGCGAFLMGRRQQAQAVGPNPVASTPGATTADYDRRVVAYLYDNVPIMRAELGEYLIARFGGERLEFLINRKIVEIECAKHNIVITEADVEDRLQQDLRSFGPYLTEKEFVDKILRRFNKTLYEWREDVIRPKLMMERLVKSKVHITEKDLHEGFEARYGPKVQCRIIVIDAKAGLKAALDVYGRASKGPKEFAAEASKQAIPNLAQTGGTVPPIHKYFGDKRMEETAFSLKDNEVAQPLQMPDGTYVIMMREHAIPADTKADYEKERMKLTKEMFELRLAQKIPEEIARLRNEAHPRPMITRQEPRGSMAPAAMAPAPVQPRTDVAPLVKQPVVAPGYTPLSASPQPPAPIGIVPPAPLLLPPNSGITTEKKK